ncbi:MAG: SGNH/GDSL hydrolase family protein [Planctomycetia bacterium]
MLRTLLLLSALVAASTTAARADDVPAVECRPRGGLPNFFAKARAGGEIRVAYLGGSITAAAGWRVKSLEHLRTEFPRATFSEINAAIGGTGSDLGSFRVAQDVVVHAPDLVFVEFAVNDGLAPPEQIMATMEGIVRQIRRADSTTDICFVYTISEPFLGDLAAGRCQRSAAAMESVADHYRIPSVHFGVEVARRLAAGTLTFKAAKPEPFDPAAVPMLFSTDGVHPLIETGQVLYTEVLARAVDEIAAAGGGTAHHDLPEPLRADAWEQARLVPITADMLSGSWQRVQPENDPQAKAFAHRMPVLWKADGAGASLRLRVRVPEAPGVTARRMAIYDLLGPGGGVVNVSIDGGAPRRVPRIDPYCTYWRLATLPVGDLSPGEHEIEITLTDERLDKQSILFEHNRGDLAANPSKYAPHVWYASAALVFGDAVAATGDTKAAPAAE